jgi:RimJ/RimL family protein N-acetyltransferase
MLLVREIEEKDIEPLVNYWFHADKNFLVGMGVDVARMPAREEFVAMLQAQLRQTYKEKQSYCIIWLSDNEPVGHSNVNKIEFGKEAYMHLHMWSVANRKQGQGTELVRMTLPFFFNNLKLQKIYCEPYALNLAPNKTLDKLSFTFVKQYITTPGWINFEQLVNRWELSREKFESLQL